MLQTADNQEHLLLRFPLCCQGGIYISLMVLMRSRFQIKGAVVHVDDLEQGFIIWLRCVHLNLLKERRVHIIWNQTQLIAYSHDHVCFICLQSSLGQVSALIVEEAMAITRPSDALHQNSIQPIAGKSQEFCKKVGERASLKNTNLAHLHMRIKVAHGVVEASRLTQAIL